VESQYFDWSSRGKGAISAPVSNTILIAENLRKVFDGVVAVDSVTLRLEAGQTLALLGANGAGKTTTISMLLGLLLPTAGRIEMLGEDMIRHRHRVLGRINFSSPYVDLPRRLTVEQNLRVFARLYNVPRPNQRVAELAEALDLRPILKQRSGSLSAGQKTRVSLAKALVNEPEILLLDEPTASLDPDTADWMRSYLERYQAERSAAVLLASHNMAEVERLSHQVLMMQRGRIVAEGTAPALIAHYGRQTLEDVFLDIARQRERSAAE
jgi:ABC-2 type transport system ATP-binding protein